MSTDEVEKKRKDLERKSASIGVSGRRTCALIRAESERARTSEREKPVYHALVKKAFGTEKATDKRHEVLVRLLGFQKEGGLARVLWNGEFEAFSSHGTRQSVRSCVSSWIDEL